MYKTSYELQKDIQQLKNNILELETHNRLLTKRISELEAEKIEDYTQEEKQALKTLISFFEYAQGQTKIKLPFSVLNGINELKARFNLL